MIMRKMLKEMQTHLTNGENLVLVTVTASSGAAPREPVHECWWEAKAGSAAPSAAAP